MTSWEGTDYVPLRPGAARDGERAAHCLESDRRGTGLLEYLIPSHVEECDDESQLGDGRRRFLNDPHVVDVLRHEQRVLEHSREETVQKFNDARRSHDTLDQ